MKSLIVVSLLLARIAALAFDAPLATPAWEGFAVQDGLVPAPTQAPSMEDFVRRQSAQTVPGLIVAPDGTCGYVSGFSASPFGLCCSTCSCGFATTPGYYGQFYCCNSATCESRVPTTCINANQYTASSACNSACEEDPTTMKCTAEPYIYCNLAEFEQVNVQALFCDSVTVNHTQSIYTTFSGEIGRVLTPWTGPSVSITSTSASSTSTSSSTSTTSTSTSSTSATSSAPTTTSTVPSPAGSSTPIGPIVGGVVGGVGALAIVGLIIFFCIRRNRSKETATGAPGGPPGGPAGGPAGADGSFVPPMQQQSGYGAAAVGGAAGGAAAEKISPQVVESPEYGGGGKPGGQTSQYPQQYGGYYSGGQQAGYPQQGQYPPQQYPQQQYGGVPPQDNRYSTQSYAGQPGYGSPDPSTAGGYGAHSPMGSPPPEHLSPQGYGAYGQSPPGGAAELHGATPQSPTPTYNTTATGAPQGHVVPPAEGGMRYEVQG